MLNYLIHHLDLLDDVARHDLKDELVFLVKWIYSELFSDDIEHSWAPSILGPYKKDRGTYYKYLCAVFGKCSDVYQTASVPSPSSYYTRDSDIALASLGIRHLMEALPGWRPRVDGKLRPRQDHWQIYWQQQYNDSLTNPDHPLAFLSASGENNFLSVGLELYNILSRPVHRYKGPFVIDPNHWSPEVVTVLRAVCALGTVAPQV